MPPTRAELYSVSPEAREVLHVIVEEFRKMMAPEIEELEFREEILSSIEKGFLRIVQLPNEDLRLELTHLGRSILRAGRTDLPGTS